MTELTKKRYLNYISTYVVRYYQDMRSSDYDVLFHDFLGDKMFDASTNKIKELAHFLYRTEVIYDNLCRNTATWVRKLPKLKRKNFTDRLLSLLKEFGFIESISEEKINTHIKKATDEFYEPFMDVVRTPSKPRSPVEKKSSPKSPIKKRSPSEITITVRSPPTPKEVAKAKEKKRKSRKGAEKKWTCKSLKLRELRMSAVAQGIKGYEKMRKADLCKKLGIPE